MARHSLPLQHAVQALLRLASLHGRAPSVQQAAIAAVEHTYLAHRQRLVGSESSWRRTERFVQIVGRLGIGSAGLFWMLASHVR
jgi:hypothetical protein